jgi:hypothetical protein
VIVFDNLTCDLTRSILGDAITATFNLALTYSALGRYQDALVLQEKTLECFRMLPENHPKNHPKKGVT